MKTRFWQMLFRDYLVLVEKETSTKEFSPAFKKWFGKSRVVDRFGNPMIMYHGTGADIEVFHTGTHFGTAKAASQRIRDRVKSNRNIIPVYLRICNPLVVADLIASDEAALLNYIIRHQELGMSIDVARKEGAYAAAKLAGYDGICYRNDVEDAGKKSWVIFDSNQAKSAVSNEIYSDSPHIRESH